MTITVDLKHDVYHKAASIAYVTIISEYRTLYLQFIALRPVMKGK